MNGIPSRAFALRGLVAVLAIAGLGLSDGQFIYRVPPGSAVTNSSTISFDQADLEDIAGFKVQVDGGSYVDLLVPGQGTSVGTGWAQAAGPGGTGITFTFPVSALSLSNGSHTLVIFAYNISGTLSATGSSLMVVKS